MTLGGLRSEGPENGHLNNGPQNPHLLVLILSGLIDVFFILDYDSMCSEMDFTQEKSFSSNYKNFKLLLTAATALSQNGQTAV